ncbi:NUDIX hydrolase [Sulfurimonas microaerophilic]|uniref:NUDIX hydrolase n=1 Tax=Sulfurimonas microaerophilic TaxID=3058392 RepID=UPI0027153520|nr:NUDIX hydrolase [Sulfurimonas sp. hsl 1-7]
MDKITCVKALEEPQYIQPIEIHYTQNEQKKKWEAIISHDSVAILLWHKEKDAFIIVKQLRPPVFNLHKDGYMHELCAGIVDKETSLIQIAKEEVQEECGYDIPTDNLHYITSFFTSVGISGAKQTLYYGEIDESMRVHDGGGIHEEEIEVIELKTDEAKKFMFDESFQKTPGMMMAFYWFFENIKN